MTYTNKDKKKFENCTHLITRGAPNSSSERYRIDGHNIFNPFIKINDDDFDDKSVVGVSVNGRRKNRLSFDKDLVKKAIDAQSWIVCDNEFNRNRDFNIGERELYDFLIKYGCRCYRNNHIHSVFRSPKQRK